MSMITKKMAYRNMEAATPTKPMNMNCMFYAAPVTWLIWNANAWR